jgi:hypothetical protein
MEKKRFWHTSICCSDIIVEETHKNVEIADFWSIFESGTFRIQSSNDAGWIATFCVNYVVPPIVMPVTVAERSKESTVSALSEAGIVHTNHTHGMAV